MLPIDNPIYIQMLHAAAAQYNRTAAGEAPSIAYTTLPPLLPPPGPSLVPLSPASFPSLLAHLPALYVVFSKKEGIVFCQVFSVVVFFVFFVVFFVFASAFFAFFGLLDPPPAMLPAPRVVPLVLHSPPDPPPQSPSLRSPPPPLPPLLTPPPPPIATAVASLRSLPHTPQARNEGTLSTVHTTQAHSASAAPTSPAGAAVDDDAGDEDEDGANEVVCGDANEAGSDEEAGEANNDDDRDAGASPMPPLATPFGGTPPSTSGCGEWTKLIVFRD